MPALVGFALRERVHELTRLPTVLATSAQARVLAERWIGAARGVADVMVLLLADAVEAGIVSNGRLLGGRRGNAGQIGHVNVEPNGLACVCGARGCLWAYASTAALQAEINRPLRRAPAAVVERTGVMIGRAVASAAAVFDLRLVLLAGQRAGDVRPAAARGGQPGARPAQPHRLPAQHAGPGAAARPARARRRSVASRR